VTCAAHTPRASQRPIPRFIRRFPRTPATGDGTKRSIRSTSLHATASERGRPQALVTAAGWGLSAARPGTRRGSVRWPDRSSGARKARTRPERHWPSLKRNVTAWKADGKGECPSDGWRRDDRLSRIGDTEAIHEIDFMAESAIEHGFGIQVTLAAPGEVDPSLVSDLRVAVQDAMGTEVPRGSSRCGRWRRDRRSTPRPDRRTEHTPPAPDPPTSVDARRPDRMPRGPTKPFATSRSIGLESERARATRNTPRSADARSLAAWPYQRCAASDFAVSTVSA